MGLPQSIKGAVIRHAVCGLAEKEQPRWEAIKLCINFDLPLG